MKKGKRRRDHHIGYTLAKPPNCPRNMDHLSRRYQFAEHICIKQTAVVDCRCSVSAEPINSGGWREARPFSETRHLQCSKGVTVMSKRFSLIFGAAVFVAAVLTMASPDRAQAASQVVERCDQYVSFGYFENQGECMKRLKTGRKVFCQRLKDRGYFERANTRYKNMGDCISYYKSQGH
jgi:hypothetical protein